MSSYLHYPKPKIFWLKEFPFDVNKAHVDCDDGARERTDKIEKDCSGWLLEHC